MAAIVFVSIGIFGTNFNQQGSICIVYCSGSKLLRLFQGLLETVTFLYFDLRCHLQRGSRNHFLVERPSHWPPMVRHAMICEGICNQ